jgi:hypothetical protein
LHVKKGKREVGLQLASSFIVGNCPGGIEKLRPTFCVCHCTGAFGEITKRPHLCIPRIQSASVQLRRPETAAQHRDSEQHRRHFGTFCSSRAHCVGMPWCQHWPSELINLQRPCNTFFMIHTTAHVSSTFTCTSAF